MRPVNSGSIRSSRAINWRSSGRGWTGSRSGRSAYQDGVGRIKEYILAGDAFQVVLSQRFTVPRAGIDPFDVYRALRVTNPSPYMFHLEFPEAVVTGASPECLVRLTGDTSRPSSAWGPCCWPRGW